MLVTAGAIAVAGPAFAQNAAQQNAAQPENGYPTFILTGFLGGQWFQLYQGDNARTHTFDKGIIWGERFTEDVHKYWGLEESLALGYNRLNIPVAGLGTFRSDTINTQLTVNVIAVPDAAWVALLRPFLNLRSRPLYVVLTEKYCDRACRCYPDNPIAAQR